MDFNKLQKLAKIIGNYQATLEINLIYLERLPKEEKTPKISYIIENIKGAIREGRESWESMLENKNDNNE